MRAILIAMALTWVAFASQSSAAEDTPMPDVGNGFWAVCEGKRAPDSAGFRDEFSAFCFGFVMGAAEGLQPMMANAKQWCFAPGVTAGQKFDTVMKFMEDHPEQRNEPTVILILRALKPIFACKAKTK